jgi:hypothetical protein
MCLPLIPMIAIAAAVSSTAAAGTAIYSGIQQKKAGDANATNQRIAAIGAENAGASQAADAKMKARKIGAAQSVAAAGSGIDTATGTPLNLAAETAEFGELDKLRIINNASRTAWGYQAQANIDEWQGSQAQTAGFIKANSSLLSGATDATYASLRLN